MTVEISTASKEYVRVKVDALVSGVPLNPTADVVSMAFMVGNATPTAPDFKAATWETDSTVLPAKYWARCLVGVGGAVVLTAGIYTVWVKVTDTPETPVRRAGLLRVI